MWFQTKKGTQKGRKGTITDGLILDGIMVDTTMRSPFKYLPNLLIQFMCEIEINRGKWKATSL